MLLFYNCGIYATEYPPFVYHNKNNRTEQNRIYFNKRVQGRSFEIQSIHA